VQDLRTSLEVSMDKLITKKSIELCFNVVLNYFGLPKNVSDDSPRMDQVPTTPRLLQDTQSTTAETQHVIIVAISARAPTIQVAAVRDIRTEQKILSDTEKADGSDEIILDLSRIDTSAAILLNWEKLSLTVFFSQI
jgi:hypothetical protein